MNTVGYLRKGIFSWTVFFILAFYATSEGQSIKGAADSLSFNVTYDTAASNAVLEIYNPGSFAAEVVDIDLFRSYGEYPFELTDTAFYLAAGDTHAVNVSFLPEHNITYDLPLVVRTKEGFGHALVWVKGQGRFSRTYYNSTENLEGSALRTALKNRISQPYNSLGYTIARDNMYATIDNVGGVVTCVYTGRTASFSTRAGANSNNFNTEHTFPQGHFNQNEPMRSDIFHLFPTDVSANSTRGNDPFGVVSSASWQQGGSKSGGNKFEPRDLQKGATARAMMYFVVRYQDYLNFFQGQESILRTWHEQFPPGAAERQRNEDIHSLQNNRNPFIDYPQFIERMPSLVSNTPPASVTELYYSDDVINLATANGRFDYQFVLYNPGNEDIELDNFSLSDTSLRFETGFPASVTLEPSEHRMVKISFNGSTNYAGENLSFDTDIIGQSQVVIPIQSGATFSIEDRDLADGVEIYPNPVRESFTVSLKEGEVVALKIIDLKGRVVMEQSGKGAVFCGGLKAGTYVVEVESSEGFSFHYRIVKE